MITLVVTYLLQQQLPHKYFVEVLELGVVKMSEKRSYLKQRRLRGSVEAGQFQLLNLVLFHLSCVVMILPLLSQVNFFLSAYPRL